MPKRPSDPVLQLTPEAADRVLESLDSIPSSEEFYRADAPMVAGYTIDRVVGRGGEGSVYKAFRDGSDRPVALKIIRDVAGRGGLKRVLREVEILEAMKLPNVPRILDYGEQDGALFIAEDFVEGQRIDDCCARSEHGVLKCAVELLVAAARAVQSIHERGVIHRDLKPGNILVTPAGDVMIVDFGIAFLQDAPADTMSVVASPVGTLAFMAPEQARGGREGVSTRSDVYGLGATAYMLLTGHTPHDTQTTMFEAIHRIGTDSAREPRTLRADLPKDLAAILSKACAADPAGRYASAADFAADLERWLKGDPVEATTPGRWRRSVRWVGKRPKMTSLIASVMIAAIAIASAYFAIWWGLRKPHSVESDRDSTRLRSRAGAILHEWQHPHGRNRHVKLLNVHRDFGGRPLVVMGVSDEDQPGLFVYDAAQLNADPLWTSGFGPDRFTVPLGGLSEFVPQMLVYGVDAFDLFENLPGDELVVFHADRWKGASAIRIYDLAGKVLYEAWHTGHVFKTVWLESERTLVFLGDNSEVTWRCRGVEGVQRQWPTVLFSLKPELGTTPGWIATPSRPGTTTPGFYKCIFPAWVRDDHWNEKFGFGPIQSADPIVRFQVTVGNVQMSVDRDGLEVSRRVYQSMSQATDLEARHPITTETAALGDLPPIVAGCE